LLSKIDEGHSILFSSSAFKSPPFFAFYLSFSSRKLLRDSGVFLSFPPVSSSNRKQCKIAVQEKLKMDRNREPTRYPNAAIMMAGMNGC